MLAKENTKIKTSKYRVEVNNHFFDVQVTKKKKQQNKKQKQQIKQHFVQRERVVLRSKI